MEGKELEEVRGSDMNQFFGIVDRNGLEAVLGWLDLLPGAGDARPLTLTNPPEGAVDGELRLRVFRPHGLRGG